MNYLDLAKRIGGYVLENSNSGYLLHQQGKLRIYWCGGISHSVHCWKTLDHNSLVICTLPWYHGETTFAKCLKYVLSVNPSLTAYNFVILCNSRREVIAAIDAGWPQVALCTHTSWLDEKQYCVVPDDTKEYDMVINCRPEGWKRPFIAKKIDNLAVIKGFNFRPNDYFDLSALNPGYINDQRLDMAEVVKILSKSRVGGIFSAVEGACYSSAEYLLCGLPVISTDSLGGRDEFYNSTNSIIIRPDPDECKDALQILLQRLLENSEIRAQIREDYILLATAHRVNAYNIIDKASAALGEVIKSHDIIEQNRGLKMTKYTSLSN
jgi:hypothetical protein